MKVIERGFMPCGAKINLEDWSEDYRWRFKNDVIAIFPKVRFGSVEHKHLLVGGTVRLALHLGGIAGGSGQTIFDHLCSGRASIQDYKNLINPDHRHLLDFI